VSEFDDGGTDFSNFFSLVENGDSIGIQNKIDGDQFQIFDITGNTDDGTHVHLDVTFVAQEGVDFPNGTDCVLIITRAGSFGQTGSQGETGATGATGETGSTGATGLTGGEQPAIVDTSGISLTLTDVQEVLLATAGGITVTLPDATVSGVGEGKVYWIKDRDGNAATSAITIATTSAQTINSFVGTATTFLMTSNFQAIALVSDGANWQMMSDDQPVATLEVGSTGETASIAAQDLMLVTTGGVTITLPDATTVGTGHVVNIKDSAGNAAGDPITIDTVSAQTIDGVATATLDTDFQSLTVVSDGSNWVIV
jgi:hypothetical protein